MVMAFNLNHDMKRLVLGKKRVSKRMNLPAGAIKLPRPVFVKVSRNPAFFDGLMQIQGRRRSRWSRRDEDWTEQMLLPPR